MLLGLDTTTKDSKPPRIHVSTTARHSARQVHLPVLPCRSSCSGHLPCAHNTGWMLRTSFRRCVSETLSLRPDVRPSEAGGQPEVTQAGAAGAVPPEQPELGFRHLLGLQTPLIQRPDLSQLQAPFTAAAMQPCGQAPAASTAYNQVRTQQPLHHESCVQQQQQGRLQAGSVLPEAHVQTLMCRC